MKNLLKYMDPFKIMFGITLTHACKFYFDYSTKFTFMGEKVKDYIDIMRHCPSIK